MLFRAAADAVLLVHFAFIAFVVAGALLAARWRWLIAVHLPAAAWGALIEVGGWICPLTYVENLLRVRAGEAGYAEGFVEHYLLPIIYPGGLTRDVQFVLAAVVIVLNVAIYGWVFAVRGKTRKGITLVRRRPR